MRSDSDPTNPTPTNPKQLDWVYIQRSARIAIFYSL
ncbi:MAG: hypothetical protein ACJAS9_002657 [Polaribacter sp.]|jgi:hypothetical protein